MKWYRLLLFFLWISPHVLIVPLAFLIYKRQLYRDFRFFGLYALYEIGSFALLYGLNSVPSVTASQYAYAFAVTMAMSIVLRFGVINEVSEELFRQNPVLKVAARRWLRWSTLVLALIGVTSAIYAPGDSDARVVGGLAAVSQGMSMIQCGLLVFLLAFGRFFGLCWRGYAFGIALGLGVLASVDLATSAIRAQIVDEQWARALNLLTTGSYLICTLIWLGYILAPERKPAVLVAASGDELDDWNRELQRMLRP